MANTPLSTENTTSNKKSSLWTRNFTIIILGTIISAIGGVGTSFAMSVVIFKETQSTLLSGIYTASILLPQVILPVVIGPYIDRFPRKNIIIALDFLLGLFFLFYSFITRGGFFNYYLFLAMGLIINTNSVIYSTAYNSLYPELIPNGMYQEGYSISSMIYPLSSTLMMPVAALMFEHFGVSILFLIQGILLILAATFECFIRINENLTTTNLGSLKAYFNDLIEGFSYIKEEKGLMAIFTYFFFTMFCSQGIGTLLIPFFENHAILTLTHYSLLISMETIGRVISGFIHYHFKIPHQKKFLIASSVYFIYELSEGILMFMAFPLMLIIRFMLGFLGTNSANIRMSAVQSYIPSQKRGRINGFSQLLSLGGVFFGSLCSGLLGEYFDYQYLGLFYALVGILAVYFIIIKNKNSISAIYNRDI